MKYHTSTMASNGYRPPIVLKKWVNDIPDGELYKLMIFDNYTVCSASGRYAHSSGSMFCTWERFIEGDMNSLVIESMGEEVLTEAKLFITLLANNK